MNPLDDPAAFEEGKQYSIRPTERANRDVEAELERLSQWNGSEQDPTPQESIRLALEWLRAYQEARASLANFPLRCPLVPEQKHFKEAVRQLIFRRAPSAPAYRLLFSIEEAGEDGPVVYLRHVRHGSRRPISRSEAKELYPS
jgi:hypothetical protein